MTTKYEPRGSEDAVNFWYSYDPEDGFTRHATADEAMEAAEASLEYHRDRSSDGWHENTSDIEWGLLVAYGEAREVNRRETPGGEHDYVCDYEICSSRGDPLEDVHRRFERSIDFYQQRFEALRTWVKGEVEPLSHDVAHRYWAIVANGSPAPHESADWKNTLHGLRLRAEQAERERDALLARNATLEHALKCLLLSRDAAWTGGHDWNEAVEQACKALGVAPEDE